MLLVGLRADVREFSLILRSHAGKLGPDLVLPDYALLLQEAMQGIMGMGTPRDAARSLVRVRPPPPSPPPPPVASRRLLGLPEKNIQADFVTTCMMLRCPHPRARSLE